MRYRDRSGRSVALLTHDLGDEFRHIRVDDLFDPIGELAIRILMARMALILPAQLKQLPAFALELLHGGPILPPALSIVKELLNCDADGDREAKEKVT
jgi:hypothetical protein